MSELTLDMIQAAVRDAAAFRAVTRLEPAGGPADKVFPPTYLGAQYHRERRRVGDEEVDTVVLDSVQSQANRMELALLAARDREELSFPLIVTEFGEELPHIGRITALDAPHRIADAIFRDSLLDGVRFRDSDVGKKFTSVSAQNATPLLELCPTALVFGVWDSTGPRGGLGAKFARALVSEIVGFDAVDGVRTASRIDPLPIAARVEVYVTSTGGWTLEPSEAATGKKGEPERRRPSELNLGNVTPDLARDDRRNPLPGGVTISHALQTTVLSVAALRRLRFPIPSGISGDVDEAARTLLAALGIAAIAYGRREGYDLRSRCLLVPTEHTALELVPGDGTEAERYELPPARAAALLGEAAEAAMRVGLPWSGDDIVLRPEPKLVDLVRRSEALLAEQPAETDGDAGK